MSLGAKDDTEGQMTPMSDAEAAILGKLAEVAQQQAVSTERLVAVLERVDDHLGRMDSEREREVGGLKSHMDASFSRSDSWWRKAFLVAVVLIMLSNVVGVVLTRFIPFLKP